MKLSWSSQVAVMASRPTSTAASAIAYSTSQGILLHWQQSQRLFVRPGVSWQQLVYNLWLPVYHKACRHSCAFQYLMTLDVSCPAFKCVETKIVVQAYCQTAMSQQQIACGNMAG